MTEERPSPTQIAKRELALHKRAYDAGVLAALYDALDFCRRFNVCPPVWMIEAMMKTLERLATGKFSHGRGRTGNPFAKYRADLVHYVRWDTVTCLRDHQSHYREEVKGLAGLDIPEDRRREAMADMLDAGRTWDSVYEHAANQLLGTAAYGSPATIKKSYLLVQKANRDGTQHGRFYLGSHRTRTKLGIDV